MPPHAVRPEVLEFIRATEDLLSPALLESDFTTNECDFVGYYLMAISGERSSASFIDQPVGMQLVRSEIAHFGRAAQSLIAVSILSLLPLTEQEQVIVAYFVTRLQKEFDLPSD